jgi:hypothetical protein
MLQEAIDEQRLPLAVETLDWTHGYGHILIDHVDVCHTEAQGRRLAERVLALKQQCPGLRVYILSHSAGCAVSLAAGEHLPPNSVESMILLAPAVSAGYDLRPALTATARSIEVFYSHRDWAALGIGTTLVGTADGCWAAAAGRIGFQPSVGPGEEGLYTRLRQHAWSPCVAWAGNGGGHYGAYQPTFLRAYVLPLLNPASSQ